jgi:hypothetical protein
MPVIGGMKVEDMNRLAINRLINALVLDGKLVQSRRVFSVIKQFLGWCEFQGIIESSPLATMSLNKVAGGAKPKPRERVLSDDELEKFWHMWDFAEVSESTRWALALFFAQPEDLMKFSGPDETSSTFIKMYGIRVSATNLAAITLSYQSNNEDVHRQNDRRRW